MQNKQYNILVVDDTKTMRLIITAILTGISTADFIVEEAANGQDALELIKNQQFDAVITDLNMPVMSGLELCEAVRNTLKITSLPIVVITNDSYYNTVDMVFKAGASDFINKPINELELESRLLRLLTQHTIEKNLYLDQQNAKQSNVKKSELLAMVSHELKAPLNAISGYSQILQRTNLDDYQSEMTAQLLTASEIMQSLISKLLELEQIETNQKKVNVDEVSINALFEKCLSMSQLDIDKMHIIINKNIADDVIVQSDKDLLSVVLINLLSNAIKYNNPSGSITINCNKVGTAVQVDIADTGIGMTPEDLQKIYDPFTRFKIIDDETQGHGLGMTITKSTAELLGIEMSINSEVGKGTSISLTLP